MSTSKSTWKRSTQIERITEGQEVERRRRKGRRGRGGEREPYLHVNDSSDDSLENWLQDRLQRTLERNVRQDPTSIVWENRRTSHTTGRDSALTVLSRKPMGSSAELKRIFFS
eukprot:762849-Hanusia_phi.AAC.5